MPALTVFTSTRRPPRGIALSPVSVPALPMIQAKAGCGEAKDDWTSISQRPFASVLWHRHIACLTVAVGRLVV